MFYGLPDVFRRQLFKTSAGGKSSGAGLLPVSRNPLAGPAVGKTDIEVFGIAVESRVCRAEEDDGRAAAESMAKMNGTAFGGDVQTCVTHESGQLRQRRSAPQIDIDIEGRFVIMSYLNKRHTGKPVPEPVKQGIIA